MFSTKTTEDYQAIFGKLPLATAILERNDDSEWSIYWQNEAAHSLWGQYDIDSDFDFKLALMDAMTRVSASSFVAKLPQAVQAYRFIATAANERLLLQFLPEIVAVEYRGERRRQEDIYQLVVEGSKVGVLDWNVYEDFMSFNDKFYDICNLIPAELGNNLESFYARIHPQDLLGLQEALESHLDERWPFEQEFRIQSSVGHYIWVQASGKAVWSPQTGKATRFVAMFINISERKNAEDNVRQRELLIEQIIDSLPISIYVKDAQGCFRFFSKQTEQDTGISRQEAIGRTDYEIFPPELARQQALSDQMAIKENRIIVTEEKVPLSIGERWLMLGKGPIKVYKESKPQTWILGFSIDITQRKAVEEMLTQARDEAQKASQAKSEFLSVMSHEIRTPLNSVIGTAGLLLETELDEEQAQHTEMIKRSGQHLLHLINDILDFNKLDAGKMLLENRPMNLRTQVDTVLAITGVNAKLKDLPLNLVYPQTVDTFYQGDEARIRQILLNLIGNAIKFTEKGSVSLVVSEVQSAEDNDKAMKRLRFEVVDTGIGIPADKIGLLFSEFTQVDASTTRKFGGTGLGLSICKKLVEAMHGQIGIISQLGQGSTFWFEIPLDVISELDAKKEMADDLPELERKLKILVAEDNLPNQLLIKAILVKMGHDVVLAVNGLKVLEAIEQAESDASYFDLILMDMQMPEMDGLEATAHIRQLDSEVSIVPIIALTANVMAGDRERVIGAGMNDYLTKPIDIAALKRALKIWGSLPKRT